ncbi:uncharacterized protein LOC121379510 [Gigantopelta aegis]|uniref:uncharacterized protein LOC121379510 n=1 Tax=Gigantopelta aegis TaxID=1735272 RepID=UPI001B888DBD|nr:uncharacterized protein LOC121379510 [Gigantopelta aegis]
MEQDCNAANVYSSPTLCGTSKAVQGFCPADKKPAMPWPNIINCGVLGSYNRLDPFQMPVEPTCGATRSQTFTVTLEIKYRMLLPCTTTKVDLLKNVVQLAFQTLGSSWSGLTDYLAVSGSCSQSASKEVFIKTEFSKLLSTINSLPPIGIIKRAVIEDSILEGAAFSAIANAELQKNEVVFDQFVSCDTDAYVIVGNDCVQCGPGSFFNATLKQCVLCPIGSYNPTPGRLDSCEQCTQDKTTLRRGSDASTDCVATRSQTFTVTLEIKYRMLLPCTTTKLNLLKTEVQSAFQTLGSSWSGLTNNLAVSGTCSQLTSTEVFIKAEFSKLLSTINSLPPIEIIKQAVLEDNILEGAAFLNIANAELQKNEVVFDQFASCDTDAYVIVGNDCVQCGSGSFFSATLKQCVLCPVGSYNPTPGRIDSCEQCTQDKTTLRRGSDASTDCVANCPVGQYLNNSVCTDCPNDYYQDEEGKDYCRPCPLGKITKNPKTDSKDKCFDDCPSGTELSENGTCTDCQQGYYRTQTVQDDCTKCQLGKTTREKKSRSEADCNLPDCQSGNFINATDNNTCHMCPIGQYQPFKWRFECMRCNENYATESEGSASAYDCKFYCPEGYEVESAQNEKCRICPRGTYRQNNGNERFSPCQNCTQNTTDGPGSKTMSDCSIPICTAGQRITNNQCDDCPVDTYQNVSLPHSNTRCMNCPDGFGTMTEKSTAETDCKFYCVEGYEVESAQSKTCRICPRGTYRQNNGNERFSPCQDCTQNTTNGPGSKTMADCYIPICTAGQKIKNNQCDDCPVDTYQNVNLPHSNTRCTHCPGGFGTMTTKSMNKDNCKPVCSQGKQYNKTSASCVPCPQGYWKNDSMRFDQCEMCRENYTTPGEGSTNPGHCLIRDCPPGTKISGENCESCPFGEYQDEPRQTVCKECGPNLNTSKTGASSIDDCTVSCAPGLEGPDGSCVACRDDTVKPYIGNGQCEPCTENRTSNANHTSCTGEVFCAIGAEYVSSTTDCSLCAIGFFKNIRGNTPCKACPGNYITSSVGTASMTDCSKLQCVPGFYGSSDSCIPCDLGFYKSAHGTDNCTKCDESLTTSSKASTAKSDCSVVVCDAGSYRTQSNQCQPCPKGKYQPVSGMDSCESCPNDNYTTENPGSTREDQCLKVCEKGHYRNEDNKCSVCGIGFYQPSEGQAECLNCSSEHPYTTANTGSTSVEQCLRVCDKGSYRPSTNRNGCIKCEIGKYQPDNGKTSCILCGDAAIVTTLQTGSPSSESCIPICPAGKYLDTTKRACEPCELGKYKDKTGTRQECDDCPDKKTTASTGATSKDLCSLDDCQAGFYRKSGGTGCSECERNTYQDEPSQSSCKPCPGSKVTLITGAKSIQRCVLDCPSGEEYNGLVDNGSCVKCKIGEYRVKEKSDKCLVCPEEQTTISTGASKCVDSKVPPKPSLRVSIHLKLRFKVTSCGNPMQVKSVLESFILRIMIRICRSWNEKCDHVRVTFTSASWCPIGRRRKRASGDLEAIVDVDDMPEVLTNGVVRRSVEGVFADAFGVDAQPDTVELKNNGIGFDGIVSLTSSMTCTSGSVLVNGTECEKCKAGTRFVDVNSDCVDCSKEGKYQNAAGQSVCLSCPGIMTPSADATHCISKCEAESDYCQNGGTCTVKSESEVSCSCPSPYTGPVCEMRSDSSPGVQLKVIVGAAVGGGSCIMMLIVIVCILGKRRKNKAKHAKPAQRYTSKSASPVKPVQFRAHRSHHRSHHINPAYNRDEYHFYDPVESSMSDRSMLDEQFNYSTPENVYAEIEEPYSSLYGLSVGSTSPKSRGTFINKDHANIETK